MTSSPAVGRGTDIAHRLRRHAIETALLVTAAAVLVRLDVVDGPWWVLATSAVVGVVAISVAYTIWPGRTDRVGLHARAAVQTAALVLITYPTGWGPILATTHLLAVADSVRHSGARAVTPVIAWAVAGTAVAQGLVATGLVSTRVGPTTAHAMAVLSLAIVALVGHRIGRMTADKEAAEVAARASEDRYSALLRASNDVILVISDGVVTAQVPEWSSLGFHADAIVGRRYVDLIHPDDRDEVVSSVLAMLTETGSTALIEARFHHPDGQWLPLEFSCRNLVDDPTVQGFVVNARDVTERKLLQAQLEYRAFHDVLTGLANRALFRERLERSIATNKRRPHPFAVLYLDIDEFKSINDSLGHDVGDQVLVEIADRLRQVLRDNDTAARMGGDEFAILLDDLEHPTDAARVATRALEILRVPFDVAGRSMPVNSSIGIVVHTDGVTADELLRNADIAMYMAKHGGKGRFEVFEPSMHTAAVERLQVETDLAQALERDEFVLHYQPIVTLDDGMIVGVEALLRWQHPARGLISPADFIPLAEATGHIVAIGRWVLREACARAADWQRRFPSSPALEVAVNVSMQQLTHGDVLQDARDALAASGLAPAHLTLELTESALADQHGTVAATLTALRADGVRIAIDDFGTGYSSLSYLQQFPVDVLKIDRSFVGGMVDGTQHPAIVRAIIDLGHTLDLETVAEGIERDTELAQFRSLRCHRGQGYLFARPDAGEVVERLLRDRRPTSGRTGAAALRGRAEWLEDDPG